jgi:glutathione S-transferase
MKIYGVPASRAFRTLWAAEEVGANYELVPTHFTGDTKKPDFLQINPNGRIPVLVDEDVVLFESMAINLYLAKKYGGKLYPSDVDDEARAIQWTIWGLTEVEDSLIKIFVNKVMLPEDQRDPALIASCTETLQRPLAVLDGYLAKRDYLLGSDFTVADLNLAGVLATAHVADFDLSEFGNVSRWLTTCTERPALARARAK